MDDAHYGTNPRRDYPQLYLAQEGFTIGYWKCIIAMIGFAVLWRVLAYICLRCMIGKFQ